MTEFKERVKDYFLHKKGAGLILSPKNWMFIEKWEKMGIPLNIVVEGIDKTFENVFPDTCRGRKIHLLSYCEPEILNLWGKLKKKFPIKEKSKQEEKSKPVTVPDYITGRISLLISSLRKYCEENPESELTSAAYEMNLEKTLNNFKGNIQNNPMDWEAIEKSLLEFDRGLFHFVLSFLSAQKIEKIRSQAEEGIIKYKNQMEPAAYEETLKEHFYAVLKKEFSWFGLKL